MAMKMKVAVKKQSEVLGLMLSFELPLVHTSWQESAFLSRAAKRGKKVSKL